MTEPAEELTRRLVKMANDNDEIMDGTTAPVFRILAAHDVVWGVWQEPDAEHGVGMLIVKGADLLREVAASGTSTKASVTAITCTCHEQAVALRRVVDVKRLWM